MELGYTLITDPKQPMRLSLSSTQRDTTPDLTFIKNATDITWRNTGDDLGSDHYILEIEILGGGGRTLEHKWTDWDLFRQHRRERSGMTDINDLDEWTATIKADVCGATKTIETHDDIPCIDSKLAHLLEAKKSIKARWKKQRWNHKLRKTVTSLNKAIAQHCALLCRQQWHEICNRIDGQLHQSKAWSLSRHLLDDTKTKSYQHDRMARIIYKAETELGRDELIKRIGAKYLPDHNTETHPAYSGAPNDHLDRDITKAEVELAVRELNTRSAAGPDGISNKALRNLDDASLGALTRYYNEWWRSGRLPHQWKTAKTVLIPKPGKYPHRESTPHLAHSLRGEGSRACPGKPMAGIPGTSRTLSQHHDRLSERPQHTRRHAAAQARNPGAQDQRQPRYSRS